MLNIETLEADQTKFECAHCGKSTGSEKGPISVLDLVCKKCLKMFYSVKVRKGLK